LNQGANTITVVARDASASQNSTTQIITINYIPPDTTAPSLVITSHSDGQSVSTSSITVSGTASDSGRGDNGISSVTVNGVRASGDTATGSGTANWSRSISLSVGPNAITAVARDNSANQNAVSQTINITYTPPNNPPTDIILTGSSVPENQPSGTTVGTLSTADPDVGNTFTYAFVGGSGSADNASFSISGNTLRTAASFNYEARSSYSVRVRSTDQGGLSFEKAFTVSVTDVVEPPVTPSNISPSNGATDQSLTPTLQGSAFSDPDTGDSHAASQWLVRRISDSVVVFDSGEDAANRTSRSIPVGVLANSVPYGWQVRYKDNRGVWSSYSTQTTFTTMAPSLTALRPGTNLVLSWSTNASGFSLVSATNLNTTNWILVSPAPTIVNGQNFVTNPASGAAKFYRLKK
jgi:hypothetical protein